MNKTNTTAELKHREMDSISNPSSNSSVENLKGEGDRHYRCQLKLVELAVVHFGRSKTEYCRRARLA